MIRITSLVAMAGLMALCAACPAREVSKVDPNQQRTEYVDVPVEVNRDIDILFVIDDSGSMADEQQSLVDNFPSFVTVLEGIKGGLPNVHIGVISTDVGTGSSGSCTGEGDDGLLQNAPVGGGGCTGPSDRYIIDVDDSLGGRDRNYSGTLADTFGCIAELGTQGCGFEQHFESMERALDSGNTQNAGFLRPEAFLAVIFITDEDDCSAFDDTVYDPSAASISDPLGPRTSFRCFEFGVTCDGDLIERIAKPYDTCEPQENSEYITHPRDYVKFLKDLKDDDSNIIVAGITGAPSPFEVVLLPNSDLHCPLDANSDCPWVLPSCISPITMGEAAPGVRLNWFLNQFPNRRTLTSICDADLSGALIVIAELLAEVIGNPCLQSNINQTDLFPDKPGLQIDCQVSDVVDPNKSNQEETPLRRCDLEDDGMGGVHPVAGQETPCWWVREDRVECTDTPTGLILEVVRSTDAATGTHIIAKCLVL